MVFWEHTREAKREAKMPKYLGIDTSNYTTSVALYDSISNTVIQKKMLLPVKAGELGIRQSDAVFHHVKQLPLVISELFEEKTKVDAIGVSTRPRNADGSYMPCFLAGESFANSLGSINNIPVISTSHQVGHVLAALYSCEKLKFIKNTFIAFHVSGGTTDCVLVKPDDDEIIKIESISSSLDLKAGQAIDRVGVMLGLQFPCGKDLEKLALKSDKVFKIKPSMKDLNCSLSGIENKCKQMFLQNESEEDIALYCISYICETVDEMTKRALNELGNLPVVYAGGVMSNTIINRTLSEKYNAYFAKPEFSCDNATGVAIYAVLKENK